MSAYKPRYTVFCDSCYSWQVATDRKSKADVEAVSHMNMYKHSTHVIDTRKADVPRKEWKPKP